MAISMITSGIQEANAASSYRPDSIGGKRATGITGLPEKEQRQVEELKKRDREVRAHEAAHIAAGGQYVTGGASFTYQGGPDGKRYAVGGEVSIDASPVPGDPEATIEKMRVVKRAAMAPANPSGADFSVAAAAASAELKAQQEVMDKNAAPESKMDGSDDKKNTMAEFLKKAIANYAINASIIRDSKTPKASPGSAVDVAA